MVICSVVFSDEWMKGWTVIDVCEWVAFERIFIPQMCGTITIINTTATPPSSFLISLEL